MLNGMPDQPTEESVPKRRRLPPWWTFIGLLFLYPLSLGPALVVAYWFDAYRVFGAGTPAIETVQTLYWPIIVLCDRWQPLSDLFDRYLQAWLSLIQ